MLKFLKVSKSGYYAWKKKPDSKRSIENQEWLKIIQEIFVEFKKKYGSPRIHEEMKRRGYKIGLHRVARIMRENGLKSTYRRQRRPRTTDSNHNKKVSPNLLNRDFFADKPNQKWVSDITYIKSEKGWLYHCMIKDLCTKEIVGWSVANHMKTSMVIEALEYAIQSRQPAEGLIFHSDRGSQYASNAFRKVLKVNKMIQSMSRKGNCWDNAVAESFFATLKCELIYDITIKSLEEAKKLLFDYIEIFYNRKRIHSGLNYMSPVEFFEMKAA
jgi:transposase InsO family protein